MSNKLRYTSPVKRLSKINLLCKQKSSRVKDENISYKGSVIESVNYYKYLGLLLDSNGKFNSTINDLAKNGLRASHSIYKLSTFNVISHDLLINTFDIMMKPILYFPLKCGAIG